jgi:hypothetical protein
MNVVLREITIVTDEEIQILRKDLKKRIFGGQKIVETISKEKKTYRYWIEFHIDQERFYYGETKPVEVENRKYVYEYQTATIHTKRGLDGSLSIISGIVNRTNKIYPNWKIYLDQIKDLPFYRQFDKDEKRDKD